MMDFWCGGGQPQPVLHWAEVRGPYTCEFLKHGISCYWVEWHIEGWNGEFCFRTKVKLSSCGNLIPHLDALTDLSGISEE